MIWEYDIARFNNAHGKDAMAALLNKRGSAGWELVCLHPRGAETDLIFKREAKQS